MNKVAIYLRLSKEDGGEESQSIGSQRDILLNFINKNGWEFVKEYVDDGYSGTNFNRPAFNNLINDIKYGIFNVILTKDLSRLGRNYIQVGYYIEEFFPNNNIRYIALTDNFDTLSEDGNEFVPFKNFINEWYAKDTSKKIRITLNEKAKNGVPRKTCFPIFGYKFNSYNEREIDSETAKIVELIFNKFIELESTKKVAEFLTENGYKTPRYYNAIKYNYNKESVLSMPINKFTCWRKDTIKSILTKEEYLGVYKTANTKSISFKNKKRIKNKNAYVFKNKYQPIIDVKTFNLAQKILKSTKGNSLTFKTNNLKGLIYCGYCNKTMRILTRVNNKEDESKFRYCCYNKDCKYSNSIYKKVIENIVKNELNYIIYKINLNKDIVIKNYCNYKKFSLNLNSNEEEENIKKRIEILNLYVKKLFEEYSQNNISKFTYLEILDKYNKELNLLNEDLVLINSKHKHINSIRENNLISIINNLTNINENELLCHKFIIKIIKNITIKTRVIDNCTREINFLIKYNKLDEFLI